MAQTHTLAEIRSLIANTRKELNALRVVAAFPPSTGRALSLVATKLEEAELHLIAAVRGGVDDVEPGVR